MELGRHARRHRPSRPRTFLLGLLALHRGHLAGEQERGPPEQSTAAGAAVAAEGASARPWAKSAGVEALDHHVDGEVVVARLGPAGQSEQPVESQVAGGEPADVAEPARGTFSRERLVEALSSWPSEGPSFRSRGEPGVGLPVRMEGQRPEEVEPQGPAALSFPLVDPLGQAVPLVHGRRTRRRSTSRSIALRSAFSSWTVANVATRPEA